MNIFVTTFALREKSIQLCEKKSLRLCERRATVAGYFFLAKAAKTLMTLLTLTNPLPTRCEAFASSAALREKSNCREIFFSPSRKGRKGEA